MSKYYLFLIFICNSFLSFSQSPIYFKIGEKEFENTDVYTVLYDEETELIYAGTNRGLFVYSQNKFIKLKAPNDHIGSSFFDLKQDNNGAIYCSNFNGQIFKINKKDKSYSLYYEIDKFKTKGHSIWFYFDKTNNLIIASDYFFILIDSNKKVILNELPKELEVNHILGCKQVNKDIYIETLKKGSKYWRIYQLKDSSFYLKNEYQIAENYKYTLSKTSYFSIYKDQLFAVKMEGSLIKSNLITSNYKHLEKERYFTLNDSSFIALNSQNGYRYFYLKNDTIFTSQMFMPKKFISAFYKTQNNQQLLGTFGEGIMVINNPKTHSYKHEHLLTDIACSPNNEVAISARSGEIFKLNNNNQINIIDKALSNVDRIWYCGTNKTYRKKGFDNFIYNNSKKYSHFIRDLKIINDSVSLFTEWSGVSIAIPNSLAMSSNLDVNAFQYKVQKPKRVVTSSRCKLIEYHNKDSLIYFSDNLGVYSKKWSKKTITPITFNSKPIDATELLMYKDQLICGTSKNGILVYKDSQLLYQINKNNGLKSNYIIQLITKENILYILTENGLQLYDLQTRKIIKTADKFTLKGVIRIAISNNKIWLITKHSYFSINLNEILNSSYIKKTPTLYLDCIKVNSNEVDINSTQHFKYDQNHFEFEYDYRDIFTKKEAKIQYTLEGFHRGWKTANTFNNLITFESLPPGKYNFKIKSLLKNEQSKLISFPFEISFPFWQTWWFYLSLIVFIIGAISYFFLLRINKIKKENFENFEKQQLISNSLDSELKAIRSQMNPHFIFNAINSIQDLVLQKDTLQSYDSLVQFSKLVRNTLNYSEQEYISINQEIEFLKNYLDLEKLRFRDQFIFEIKNSSNSKLKIPSLVVQPFVENAIKHGLLHKSGSKTLHINFNCANDIIICTVKDNGIGRLKAKEIKNRQKGFHKSFSTNAIKKRLEVLTKKTGLKYHYEILDILDEKKDIIGTNVNIYLPLVHSEISVAKKKPTVK